MTSNPAPLIGLHDDVSGLGRLLATVLKEKLGEAAWKEDVVRGLPRRAVRLVTPDTEQSATIISGLGELAITGSEDLEPDVTVTLSARSVPLLLKIDAGPGKLPVLWAGGGLALLKAILSREVKVKGLVTHLLLVIRVLQLLSVARTEPAAARSAA